jgi:phosphotransferase system HPr-like phosphotransfer protein
MKSSVRLTLNSFEKVKDFVRCNESYNGDVDVLSGRYVIDGKSIMGMYSLDLTKELEVNIISATGDDASTLIDLYKKYNLM